MRNGNVTTTGIGPNRIETEPAPAQVYQQLGRLRESLALLDKASHLLIEKIGPVVGPLPPTNQSGMDAPQVAMSMLASELLDCANLARMLAENLRSTALVVEL